MGRKVEKKVRRHFYCTHPLRWTDAIYPQVDLVVPPSLDVSGRWIATDTAAASVLAKDKEHYAAKRILSADGQDMDLSPEDMEKSDSYFENNPSLLQDCVRRLQEVRKHGDIQFTEGSDTIPSRAKQVCIPVEMDGHSEALVIPLSSLSLQAFVGNIGKTIREFYGNRKIPVADLRTLPVNRYLAMSQNSGVSRKVAPFTDYCVNFSAPKSESARKRYAKEHRLVDLSSIKLIPIVNAFRYALVYEQKNRHVLGDTLTNDGETRKQLPSTVRDRLKNAILEDMKTLVENVFLKAADPSVAWFGTERVLVDILRDKTANLRDVRIWIATRHLEYIRWNLEQRDPDLMKQSKLFNHFQEILMEEYRAYFDSLPRR